MRPDRRERGGERDTGRDELSPKPSDVEGVPSHVRTMMALVQRCEDEGNDPPVGLASAFGPHEFLAINRAAGLRAANQFYERVTRVENRRVQRLTASEGSSVAQRVVSLNKPSAGRKFLANDRMGQYASRSHGWPGHFDVIVHGSPTAVQIKIATSSYSFTGIVDHRVLANIIRKNSRWNGEPIRLLSCSTGLGGGIDTIAQNLANALKVNVFAPTDTLWFFPDGRTVIGPTPRRRTGTFGMFSPKGKT